MYGAGFAALAGAVISAATQADGYEPKGMVLANVGGITIDMNVWLPLLIALPLIFLGYTAATAKSGPNSAPRDADAKAASPAKKATPKKKAAPKKKATPKKKSTPKKKARSRSKTPKRSASKTPKSSASKTPKKSASKRATSKTPVRSKSTRRRKAPVKYDASLPTSATFM